MPDTQCNWVSGIGYIKNQANARREKRMDIRKKVDYFEMHLAMDNLSKSTLDLMNRYVRLVV